MSTPNQKPNLILEMSTFQDQNQLCAALEPLRSLGFCIDAWTPDALAIHYLCPKYFIKMVRIVTTIQDEAIRKDILSYGVTKTFWSKNIMCDPMAMYKFCRWLRTPEGTENLINAQKKTKLRKRARPGQELGTVALVQILTQQLLDFAEEKKKKKRKFELLDVGFMPASEYCPLEKHELEKRCFERYEEECCANNLTTATFDFVLAYVVEKYGNEVREAHMYEFCSSSDERKGLLRGYAEKKIALAKKVGESRLVSNLRFYVVVNGEEMATTEVCTIRGSKW